MRGGREGKDVAGDDWTERSEWSEVSGFSL